MELAKQIIPAILTDTIDDLKDKISLVQDSTTTIQIDYVDGHFVPQLSCCEAGQLQELNLSPSLEVHLMTEEPIQQIEGWYKSGVKRVIGQIEKMSDQVEFTQKASSYGLEVGLALKLETPVEELRPEIIDSLDRVLLMAHVVGVQGAEFDSIVLEKVTALHQSHPKLAIEVDGGLNSQNIKQVQQAGAQYFAVGSEIFESSNPGQKVLELERELYEN